MRVTLPTYRRISHFGTTNELFFDPTKRYSINNINEFYNIAKSMDPANFARALYSCIICGTYGLSRPALRKKLRMEREEFNALLNDLIKRFILSEYHIDTKGEKKATRLRTRCFPGGYTFEREITEDDLHPKEEEEDERDFREREQQRMKRLFSRLEYKLDMYYFKDCFETWIDDKSMLATLGLACRLLPWLNQKYGFLCENPEEEWLDYIVPMKKKTIAEKLALPQRTADRYLAKMATVIRRPIAQLNNLERDIVIAGDGKLKSGKKVFMLNPRLFYHKDTDPMIFFWKWSEDAEDLTIVDFDHESPIQRR